MGKEAFFYSQDKISPTESERNKILTFVDSIYGSDLLNYICEAVTPNGQAAISPEGLIILLDESDIGSWHNLSENKLCFFATAVDPKTLHSICVHPETIRIEHHHDGGWWNLNLLLFKRNRVIETFYQQGDEESERRSMPCLTVYSRFPQPATKEIVVDENGTLLKGWKAENKGTTYNLSVDEDGGIVIKMPAEKRGEWNLVEGAQENIRIAKKALKAEYSPKINRLKVEIGHPIYYPIWLYNFTPLFLTLPLTVKFKG